jgi:hypothetical protein
MLAYGSASILAPQSQPQSAEVIEIYDENGQRVSGKRASSTTEVNETQM